MHAKKVPAVQTSSIQLTNLFTKNVVLLCDSEGKQGYGQQGPGDWL